MTIKDYVKFVRKSETTVEGICPALFAEGGEILNRPWATRPSVETILKGLDQKYRAIVRRLNNPANNPEAFCDYVNNLNKLNTTVKGTAQ